MSSLQPFMGLSYEPRNLFRGGQTTKQRGFQEIGFLPRTNLPTASLNSGGNDSSAAFPFAIFFLDAFDLGDEWLAFIGIDHRHIVCKTLDRGNQVPACSPSLSSQTIFFNVVQRCPEFFQGGAIDVELFIDDHACDFLAIGRSEHSRFIRMQCQTFVSDNAARVFEDSTDLLGIFAGEGEVVGVAGVAIAFEFGHVGEALVEATAEEVG
jgi:hypothetical protein